MMYNWPRNTAPLSGGAVISLHLFTRRSLELVPPFTTVAAIQITPLLALIFIKPTLQDSSKVQNKSISIYLSVPSWKTLFLIFFNRRGKKWFQNPVSHLICKRKLLNINQTLGIILVAIEVHCMEQNVFIAFNKRVDYCFPHLYFNVPK